MQGEDNLEQKLIISAFKPFLLGIKIWDLIHLVLFAGVDDSNVNKVYLQSADPRSQIQEEVCLYMSALREFLICKAF